MGPAAAATCFRVEVLPRAGPQPARGAARSTPRTTRARSTSRSSSPPARGLPHHPQAVALLVPVLGLVPLTRRPHRRSTARARSAPGAAWSGRRERIRRGTSVWPSSPRARAAPTAPCGTSSGAASCLALDAGVPVVPVSLAGVKARGAARALQPRPGTVDLVVHPAVPVTGPRRAPSRRCWPSRCATVVARRRVEGGWLEAAAGRRSMVAVLGSWPPPRRAEPARRAAAQARSTAAVARPGLAGRASGAIEVRSLARREGALRAERRQGVKPASTLKLVTTAAALEASAPTCACAPRVETAGRLRRLGPHPGRPLSGGPRRPQALGALLAGRPTRRVRGAGRRAARPRACGASRDGWSATRAVHRRAPRRRWTWEDLVWGYGAEVSALSFNDNAVELPGFRPASASAIPRGCPWRRTRAVLNVVSSVTTGDPRRRRAPAGDRPIRRRADADARARLERGPAHGPLPLGEGLEGAVAARGSRALRGHRVRGGARAAGHRRWPRASPRPATRCRQARACWPPTTARRWPRIRGRQQAEPEPPHRDAAALLGAQAQGRGQRGARAQAAVESSCGASAWPDAGWSLAGRLGAVALRPRLAARDGRACSRRWTVIRTPRPSATSWPSPGATARSRPHARHAGRGARARQDGDDPARQLARRIRHDRARRAAGVRALRQQPHRPGPRGGRGRHRPRSRLRWPGT